MADCFRRKSWRKELVCHSPGFGVCVGKEQACFLVHDAEKWMLRCDLLGEETILVENVVGDHGVIGLVNNTSEIGSFEDWSVCVEQSLMVAEMVRVDLVVVADVREAFGTWHVSDLLAVDCDRDRLLAVDDFGHLCQGFVVHGEVDSCCNLVAGLLARAFHVPFGSKTAKYPATSRRSES
jgi:hypothetical protein